jgi:predicted RNase H-like HicB family nuclease
MKNRSTQEIKLLVSFMKEGDRVIAYSPALDLSTHGRTLSEAQKNFQEAFDLWMESCIEMGTLDAALKSLGWTTKDHSHPRFIPPRLIKTAEESFCIPA